MVDYIQIIKETNIYVLVCIVLFGVMVSIIVVCLTRYLSLANKLYSFLELKYKEKLKSITTDVGVYFPLTQSNELFNTLKQFKTMEQVKNFNINDLELQDMLKKMRRLLLTILWFIFTPFIIFIIGLIIYEIIFIF